MFTMQNGFGNPLPHLFLMQIHQVVLEGTISILLLHIDERTRLSDLERRCYRNIIYKFPALIYLILIATRYLWGCRRNQTLPSITAFPSNVKIKYETEKSICIKTNKMDKFNRRVDVGNENIQFLVKKWESFLF